MVFDFEGERAPFPLVFVWTKTYGMTQDLITSRLKLRALEPGDAPRLQALCGNWEVARMLEVVPYPYPDGLAETWIGELAARQQSDTAHIFAITLAEELIGVIGLERGDDGPFALGCWLGEAWWGQGYMSEAAARVVRFAFEDLGVAKLTSGFFSDNPASGQVLEKCGFRVMRHGSLPCRARDEEVAAAFAELRAGGAP